MFFYLHSMFVDPVLKADMYCLTAIQQQIPQGDR